MPQTSETPRQTLDKTKKKAPKRAAKSRHGRVPHQEYRNPTHTKPSLELFQREDCPYSQVVRKRLSELGLDFVSHNIPSQGHGLKHEQLVQAGGKDQIPFFIDHDRGVKLYESEAIVAYLNRFYGKNELPSFTQYEEKPRHRIPVPPLGRILRTRVRHRLERYRKPIENRIERYRKPVEDALQTLRGSAELVRGEIKRYLSKSTGGRPE